jgi:phosphonate transport system substrate-binding protein
MTPRLARTAPLLGLVIAALGLLTAPFPVAAGSPPAPADRAGWPDRLVVAFQPQENTLALRPNAEAMTAHLSGRLGLEVRVYLPTSYAAVVEAMRAGHADVGYFSARPYVIAHEMADAQALVAEVRTDGNTFYYSQWYARTDGDLETLADAQGHPAAFTSPTSTSGYLFPLAELVRQGLVPQGGSPDAFFSQHVFAGGYEQALRALVAGQVDVAAASDYAFERYLSEEEQAGVRVIARQGPVPSHLMAVRGSLPDSLKAELRAALLELNEPANRELLENVYGAAGFAAVDHDEHVAMLEESLRLTGIEAYTEEGRPLRERVEAESADTAGAAGETTAGGS